MNFVTFKLALQSGLKILVYHYYSIDHWKKFENV
jgi:hypothetical protein